MTAGVVVTGDADAGCALGWFVGVTTAPTKRDAQVGRSVRPGIVGRSPTAGLVGNFVTAQVRVGPLQHQPALRHEVARYERTRGLEDRLMLSGA